MQWLCSYPSNLHFATALRWKETLVQSASMQDWLSRLATAVKSQLARAVSPVPTARLGGVAPLLQQYRLHHIGNALQLKAVYTNTIRLTTKVIGHGAGAEIYGGKRVTYCGCGNCPQDWSLGVWWAPILRLFAALAPHYVVRSFKIPRFLLGAPFLLCAVPRPPLCCLTSSYPFARMVDYL